MLEKNNISPYSKVNTELLRTMDVLESMSDAFCAVDEDWIILSVNSNMEKVCLKTRRDLLGRNLLEVFHSGPEEKAIHRQHLTRAMKEQVAVSFEAYYEPLNIWTECRLFPTSTGGLAIFFSDVTERKRTSARFQNILDTIPIFAGFLDPLGRVTFVNQIAVNIISATKEDVLGKYFWDCPWWQGQKEIQEKMKASMELALKGHPQRYDIQFTAYIDGAYCTRWVDFSIVPIIRENGKIDDITVTGFDITERIEKNKELSAAKAFAESASSIKSEFLANMSHEIRTPLGAILGFAEVLKTSALSETERNRYLEIITRNGQALTKIIDDILDLSKIEAGKLEIESSPLCLSELAQEVVAMFADRAASKAIYLKFDKSGFPKFKVNSDPVRVRQVLINLIGNAIKFTTKGGIYIYGHHSQNSDGKYTIQFFVKDTGIGLSPDQARRLFVPFMQGDNGGRCKYGGTGLGLALSKKLGQALGGGVTLRTCKEDKGCTFVFTIVAEKSLNQTEEPKTSEKKKSGTELRLSGISVLIVDDSLDNRQLIYLFLKQEGAIVDQAADGAQAVEMALKKHFDVILMDIQMPGLDGYQAFARLKRENYEQPVIALTAHAMKEERLRTLSQGFCDHISKPVNKNELVQSIIDHLH